ncbi:MAG: 16S rRNA (adenine(1518)-N(6)/adenine(1519)-N(6))-dimethyltransferase RsmA [Trueperaceae bacterium]
MSSLAQVSHVRTLLGRYQLRPDKAFGQNFLIDVHALSKIVEAADVTTDDTVLEVGPGLGVLSQELATRGKHLTTVELDQRLLPVLAETLEPFANINLVHGDGLTFDFSVLPKGSLLVANLPYNVGTAILTRALESSQFKRLVFLVQKEVAERLSSAPGTKSYGALSLVVQYFGKAKRVADIKPSSFFPAPEVTSSIVRIETDLSKTANPDLFDFIHTCFRHRRKTLKKNLQMAGYGGVMEGLESLSLSPDIRAEALSLKDFEALFVIMHRGKGRRGAKEEKGQV